LKTRNDRKSNVRLRLLADIDVCAILQSAGLSYWRRTGIAMTQYRPTVSDEYAATIRRWQDSIYQSEKARVTQQVEFLGRTFTLPPKVHPINATSDLLGNAVLNEVREGDRVLDLGTGSGVNAILAASKSTNVLAVDINPLAVRCAKQNARANNVEQRISFSESDVFQNVSGTFDLIIFDPPFRWFAPRDDYELATTDENYKSLTTFFLSVGNFLTEGGRILFFFGSSADLGYVNQLIEKSGLKKQVVASRDLEKDGLPVSYFTLKLSASAGA